MQTEIDRAASELKRQQVIGIPTETVYGLAGLIDSEIALNKIFSTKERPFFDPLIVHVKDQEMAAGLCEEWPKLAQVLTNAFWPGPLTLVLNKNEKVNPIITAGLPQVGIRVPNHPLTLKLLDKLNKPFAAPSANKFKKTSPTTAEHVREEFPDLYILDGGPCEVGIESTVVGLNKVNDQYELVIYRPGMISSDDINSVLKKNNLNTKIVQKESPVSPGAMEHHYMPALPLIVLENSSKFESDLLEALHKLHINQDEVYELVLPKEAAIAARSLYKDLRKISKSNAKAILIKIYKHHHEKNWEGILNRVYKARSYPR